MPETRSPFPAPVRDRTDYLRRYQRSIEDPEGFWAEQADHYLTWSRKWKTGLFHDFEQARFEWFRGGMLNAAYNCVDRHAEKHGEKVAYFWQGDRPNDTRTVTYADLLEESSRLATVLKAKHIGKGDRVVLYMPMIVELPIAMLACARIGAIHCVVFGEYGPMALANRLVECQAKALITADGRYRDGLVVPLKKYADQALKRVPDLTTVIVCRRVGLDLTLDPTREVWWDEAVAAISADPHQPPTLPPEQMDAEDPLFILFTSGTTGVPKGIVHTHGGYLLYAAMTTHIVFNVTPDDVFWCTADVGWITGHTYGVYGPLLNGLTSVIYEGTPDPPNADRYGTILQQYKVSTFYTTPTLVRALAKSGDAPLAPYDLSALKVLGTVGEALSSKTWNWLHRHLGRGICPIVNTYWQTETGGCVLTPLPGVGPLKPGVGTLPFFGIDPVILDDIGQEVTGPDQDGVLCIRTPWPGMARTIYGDHERFINAYFSQVPGLYFTADGARKDKDGYYRIIGRIDEVINSSGNRLGSAELEAALMLHPLVAEAAVVGPPHPIKGQGVYAFIILKKDAPQTEALKTELIKQVQAEIGPIASIDAIQWVDALPKTRSGKIMRHLLNRIAAGTYDGAPDLSVVSDPGVFDHLVTGHVDYLEP